jgi:putative transposase
MAEYRRGAHTVFEIHLHLVWITKYRRPALSGEVATRVRDLIRDICGQHEVQIVKGHVAKDHVHLMVSIPPQVTISRLLQWVEREDGTPPTGGIPAFEEAVLGTAPMGERVFLLQFGKRDRRGDCEVHR